jgi:hypothetical protein
LLLALLLLHGGSFVAGNQVANYETLVMAGGAEGTQNTFELERIWLYSIDEEDKFLAMHAYCDQGDMIAIETCITVK